MTQSVVSARADARDVVIQTQITGDVDAKQTNMAAGNDSVRSKLEYRIPATQRGAAVTRAGKHQFCLIGVIADIQCPMSVGRRMMPFHCDGNGGTVKTVRDAFLR